MKRLYARFVLWLIAPALKVERRTASDLLGVEAAIRAVLANETRQGGLLWRMRAGADDLATGGVQLSERQVVATATSSKRPEARE